MENNTAIQVLGSVAAETHETATAAAVAQAESIVKARYAIAVARPRDWDTVRQDLLKACKRPRFAGSAIYLKPIGDGIKGPSIRFAEECARTMGNVDSSSSVIYDDEHKRIVRVMATDLENNKTYSKDIVVEKTVERRYLKRGQEAISVRTNSNGDKTYTVVATEDDLLNKQAAIESKALRGHLLRLTPADIVEEAMDLCRETSASSDAADPDAAKRRVFDGFAEIGVSPAMIKAYLGGSADDLQPAQLDELRAIFQTIRDGEARWTDYAKDEVAPRTQPESTAGIDAVRAAGKTAAAKVPTETPPPQQPAGEMTDDEKAQALRDEADEGAA